MNKRIIHVYEDSKFNKQLCNELEQQGIEVYSFEDHSKAFTNITPDIELIIISINELNKSLLDFSKSFKNSNFFEIPLIAVLETKSDAFVKSILKLGFNDFISKDTNYPSITNQIIEIIGKSKEKASDFSSFKVAVIDDDNYQAIILNRLLKNKGFKNIHVFTSGEKFMKSPQQFDIYLVDIVLEKISGIEIVRKIRELYPKAVIIVISGLTDSKIVTTAYSNGADDFVQKPVNGDILAAKIQAKLRQN